MAPIHAQSAACNGLPVAAPGLPRQYQINKRAISTAAANLQLELTGEAREQWEVALLTLNGHLQQKTHRNQINRRDQLIVVRT